MFVVITNACPKSIEYLHSTSIIFSDVDAVIADVVDGVIADVVDGFTDSAGVDGVDVDAVIADGIDGVIADVVGEKYILIYNLISSKILVLQFFRNVCISLCKFKYICRLL
jgi:hypothetical protein